MLSSVKVLWVRWANSSSSYWSATMSPVHRLGDFDELGLLVQHHERQAEGLGRAANAVGQRFDAGAQFDHHADHTGALHPP